MGLKLNNFQTDPWIDLRCESSRCPHSWQLVVDKDWNPLMHVCKNIRKNKTCENILTEKVEFKRSIRLPLVFLPLDHVSKIFRKNS
jgi:hypothetical protein